MKKIDSQWENWYLCFTCQRMKVECVVIDIFGGTLCKECYENGMKKEKLENWRDKMIQRDPPEEFEELNAEQQTILKEWIATHYIPAKTIWKGRTSYGEKHRFENDYERGFYISNGQFKGAMLAMGYAPAYRGELNWEFRIRLSKVGKEERKHRTSAE